MSEPYISAVIITFNEADNIERCIAALQAIAQEIIVVDSFSTDETVAIAKQMNAKVVQREWEGYSKTKNYGNSLCTGNYILSVDADEVISEQLLKDLSQLDLRDDAKAYSFKRLTNYCGTFIRYAGWYPDRKLRLFPNGKARWEGDHVHEKLVLDKGIDVVALSSDLLHYSYNSKEEHILREKNYAKLAAQERPQRNGLLSYLAYLSKLARMYILKGGFLHGLLGFQLCHIAAKGKIWKYQYSVN